MGIQSEMVDRAVRAAICELQKQEQDSGGAVCVVDCGENGWLIDGNVDIASVVRAAIEAMREPTEDMCEAGAAYYHDNYQPGRAKEQTTAPDIWHAMIDEALKAESGESST